MNQRHPIDQVFQDRLQHHELEPPMHLFDKIDAQRQAAQGQEQRKKRWIYWSATALLLLLGTALWFWVAPNDDQLDLFSPSIEHLVVAEKAQKSADQSTPAGSATEHQVVSATSDQASRNAPSAQNEPVARLPKGDILQNKALPEAQLRTVSSALNTGQNTLDVDGAKLAGVESIKTEAGSFTITEVPSQTQNLATEASETQTEAEINRPLGTWATITTKAPQALEMQPLPVFAPLIKPKQRGWRVYGEGFAGFDFNGRSLEARAPEFETYREARQNAENIQDGFSSNLRFSMISIDGFAVRSGIRYAAYAEVVQLQGKEWTNRFRSVDIPMLLGYENNRIGQLTLSANAGVLLNMAFNQEGQFLAPDLSGPVEFSSKTPDSYPAYRNRLGLAYYGSVALSAPLSPTLRVVIEPYILRRPSSITYADYAIDQRNWNQGIQIGIRKKINKYIYFAKP